LTVAVLSEIPGQGSAIGYLTLAAERPHHAYVFAGPEGCGKSLAAQAFAAALICSTGGCGECRSCRLSLDGKHPNLFLVEPQGAYIPVGLVRDEIRATAWRTGLEPGRKVFLIREADRLSEEAADVLLKTLEEPPGDSVFILMSARPHELPETVLSRCHVVTFQPLSEEFVVEALVEDGAEPGLALLCSRLTGGNLGRARRLARDADGLAFRDVAIEALASARSGPTGALAAADRVISSAEAFKKHLKEGFAEELRPFLDENGRRDDAFRGVVTRIEERQHRRERRAERDYMDWVLLAASSLLRDGVLVGSGGDQSDRVNLDIRPEPARPAQLARAFAAIEEARAALADETNLNAKLVLESAFLAVSATT
jgi:DNA polymerase-3 subunit delta'